MSLWDSLARPRVMGVLNVTPDSFSDGGRWTTPETAIDHGTALVDVGADLVDVGGESTRPGATRPVEGEELARVIPVISALAGSGVAVSVDTMRSSVARAAVGAGAVVVNDVSGGLADPAMLDTVAELGVGYVAMHWRAHSDEMQQHAVYDGPGGVVSVVIDELAARRDAALAAGILGDRLVLDPGLGFAKTADHNWELVAHLDRFEELGQPILVGASRKAFLGRLLADEAGPRAVDLREHAHVALLTLLAERRVWGLRVHDVRACWDALKVAARFAEARRTGSERPDLKEGR